MNVDAAAVLSWYHLNGITWYSRFRILSVPLAIVNLKGSCHKTHVCMFNL